MVCFWRNLGQTFESFGNLKTKANYLSGGLGLRDSGSLALSYVNFECIKGT